ncbi:MAG TPA: hypothetical protein VMH04_18685 [Candidatus Solibacter sp.]|nr:hypothetical protein [Candidatus Solibacter sp.]
MLRRVLLVIVAVVASFALTALSGYLIYRISDCSSEHRLSLVVRYICNPGIALIVGALVGLFAKKHAVPTAIVGLVPWMVTLNGPRAGNSTFAWLAGFFIVALMNGTVAALAAHFVSRVTQGRGSRMPN